MQKRTRWKTWKQVFGTPIMGAMAIIFAWIGYGALVRDELLPERYQRWKLSVLLGLIPQHWWTVIVFVAVVATIITIVQRAHTEITKVESDADASIATVQSAAETSIAKVERELDKWKSMKPEIIVTIEKVIPRVPKNSIYDIFLAVTFQLKEPQSVSITGYTLTLETPSGIRQLAITVEGDISEWTWLTETGAQMLQFVLTAPPNELTMRGEAVTGWLHFKLGPTLDNTIWTSAYFLDVISEHGVNRGLIRDVSATRFNKNMGKILRKELFKSQTE